MFSVIGLLVTRAALAQQAPVPTVTLVDAANKFLQCLEPAQREKVVLPFDSDERLNWHYFPKVRPGLALKELTAAQNECALELLRAALSARGYQKAETIRSLETVLNQLEGGRGTRDPELYYLTLFGTPSAEKPWGLRYEGHHISFNWTVIEGKVIGDCPQFLGANPADVPEGPMKGTRALGAEEDLGRALVNSLDTEQRKVGVLSETAPPEILTGAQREPAIQEDSGIAFAQLNAEQRGILLSLLEEHAGAQPEPLAEERLRKIREAGLDTVKFAWMGGLEKGLGHYYRIQGKTFLVEYDNTQNKANHIHTVWRDFKGDFGLDLLRAHYQAHADPAHPNAHTH
ncbi:MAG: DUF3500 domain-containing protein [Candidatus Hydrogenedentes bacterium]|nr:DUF3500 domain-containing protein [Candidatus Hydrogenedentota bacterium]